MGFNREGIQTEFKTQSRLQCIWTLIGSDRPSLLPLEDIAKGWALQGMPTPHPHCLAIACP